MRDDKFGMRGLTFDDVLLVPAASDVLPHQVELKTQLTRDITLNIPMISSGWIQLLNPVWLLLWNS